MIARAGGNGPQRLPKGNGTRDIVPRHNLALRPVAVDKEINLPTPTLILYLLVSRLKASVTPVG